MSVSFLNQSELIPGYLTVDRIGAGGYGEVWKVRAPGDLDKAIKVIYGYVNEERAARELKALNRIKEIRHPFLLSLERIEVVANQLLIVTELADQSLMDRFQQCRENGLNGIPRDELIEHIRDAAAALDYMLDKKGLQHLDIKPENLLLVGDRVKVADFGLVKDVADQSHTLMGGLTPVYASPEVFGGSASRQSDQYSLAIVFQQLLTGVLPFPGRTQQQLSIQHRQAEPRLTPLPETDRGAVARALSKEPSKRFSSCQAFVEALVNGKRSSLAVAASSSDATDTACLGHKTTRQNDLDTAAEDSSETLVSAKDDNAIHHKEPSSTETLHKIDRSPVARFPTLPPSGADAVCVDSNIQRLEHVEVDVAQLRPTLFIGIGGTGASVLQALKRQLEGWHGFEQSEAIQLLLLETDAATIKEARAGTYGAKLAHEEVIHANLRRPREYQERSADFLRWISRRWLYNIPRSLRTQGYRPLGRLAWVDHAEKIHVILRDRIAQVVHDDAIQALKKACRLPCHHTPRIVIVGSASGGTAGGMMFDMLVTVRTVLGELGVPDEGLCTVITHSTNGNPRESNLATANTYSFLSELQHLARSAPAESSAGVPLPRTVTPLSPLPTTYFVNLGENLSADTFHERTRAIADYLFCNTATPAGWFLDRCRSLTHDASPKDLKLRTFGLATLDIVPKDRPATWAHFLRQLVAAHWLDTAVEAYFEHPQEGATEGNRRRTSRANVVEQLHDLIQREFNEWIGSRFVSRLHQSLVGDAISPSSEFTARCEGLPPSMASQLSDVAKQLHHLSKSLDLKRFIALRGLRKEQNAHLETEEDLDKNVLKALTQLATQLANDLLSDYLARFADPARRSLDNAASIDSLLTRAVQAKLAAAVNALDAGFRMDDEGRVLPTPNKVQKCYDSSNIHLFDCGYSQRIFAVDCQSEPILGTPTATFDDLTLLRGPVEQPLFCREAEGISLAQLAHCLTVGRPEIIEAADRLHIRADVRWTRPPAVRYEADASRDVAAESGSDRSDSPPA